jgi:hypothetical protein
MAQFTVNIPDELLPAILAEFSTVKGSTTASTPEEYFAASVVEIVRQRAEQYQVGPYFKGTIHPRFLADGRGNPEYKGADAIPYVVVYPEFKEETVETVDPETDEVTVTVNDVEWEDSDQWTDPVTGTVYEYSVGEEGVGSWVLPVVEE